MSTADSLTGYGMSPQLASLLGGNPAAITGAANNSQIGAAKIISHNAELVPGSTTNSFIPSPSAGVYEIYFMNNQQTTTANVFVPVGHNLNGSLNGSTTVAQHATLIFWQYKPKNWTFK